jgi:hypothetical protein
MAKFDLATPASIAICPTRGDRPDLQAIYLDSLPKGTVRMETAWSGTKITNGQVKAILNSAKSSVTS